MAVRVSILGTQYDIFRRGYAEDSYFSEHCCDGYCCEYARRIIVCNMVTHPNWSGGPMDEALAYEKHVLRHEIVHAFLSESGLSDSAAVCDDAWPVNEEMVDWLAKQGPKIYQAWQAADAL